MGVAEFRSAEADHRLQALVRIPDPHFMELVDVFELEQNPRRQRPVDIAEPHGFGALV